MCVVPLVVRLASAGVRVSVDTWKAEVARAALEAGAVMVNDVSGLRDPAMASVCAQAGATVVITHTPRRRSLRPTPTSSPMSWRSWASGSRKPSTRASTRGASWSTPESTSPRRRRRASSSSGGSARYALDHPLLLAVSRKDFVGALTGRTPCERLGGTLAAVGAGVDAGAAILRVHDVAPVVDYLRVRAALTGVEPVFPGLHLPEALRREPSHPSAGAPSG